MKRGNGCLMKIFLADCSSLHHADGRQSIMLTFLSCDISGLTQYLTVSIFGSGSRVERTCSGPALLSLWLHRLLFAMALYNSHGIIILVDLCFVKENLVLLC